MLRDERVELDHLLLQRGVRLLQRLEAMSTLSLTFMLADLDFGKVSAELLVETQPPLLEDGNLRLHLVNLR